jgi:type I restriction enzyme S subunit
MESKNNNQLPNRWSQGRLAEIISHTGIVSDGDWIESKDQDPNGKVRLVQLADIGDGKFLSKSSRFMTTEAANRLNCTFLKEGDVLIARMPAPLGRACIFPQVEHQSVTVVDVCLIRPNENSALSNDLFKYWINTPQIRSEISLQATGSTRKRITRKKLSAFNFPVPPLPEQKRIVEKLDSLLAQVNTIQQRLNNLPNIIKRFRQSVLAAAVSGKLTKQWRGRNIEVTTVVETLNKLETKHFETWKKDQLFKFEVKGKVPKTDIWLKKYKKLEKIETKILAEIPSSWKWVGIEEIAEAISDGDHNPPRKTQEGVRHLTIKNINHGVINFENCAFVTEEGYKQTKARYEAKPKDILLTCIGTIGRTAIVGEDVEFSTDRNLAYIRLYEEIKPEYIQLLLKSPLLQQFMSGGGVGNAQSALYLKVIRKLPIPFAPIEEQCEILRLVEQYFALADTLEKNLANAKQRVDNLTQSILAKAFKGELVPQDPNDEPADKLLERIKVARLEAEKLEKAAKASAKKAAKASKASKT